MIARALMDRERWNPVLVQAHRVDLAFDDQHAFGIVRNQIPTEQARLRFFRLPGPFLAASRANARYLMLISSPSRRYGKMIASSAFDAATLNAGTVACESLRCSVKYANKRPCGCTIDGLAGRAEGRWADGGGGVGLGVAQ